MTPFRVVPILTGLLVGGGLLLGGSGARAEEAASAPTMVIPELWSGGLIVTGREAPGYVAFTFDDGPDLKSTPVILDTLEKFQVPATFFVVGRHFAKDTDTARAGAALLRQMEARGFTIGNHTTNHQHLPSLKASEARLAVAKNGADLEGLLGHKVALFRPPFGATTGPVRKMLRKGGNTTVRWNIDSQDFQRARRDGIAQRVLSDILSKGGGVVLLHDTKPWTARALPDLLESLEEANCQRLQDGLGPIVPVSLHYFLRDQNGTPRPIPAKVLKATQQTIDRLTDRCQNDN